LETPGDIQDSDAHGPLTSGNDHVGGLAGSATGNLWNTAATCEVEGAEATGGLVGSANGSSIFHSHASGSVTGEARTGGLAGKLTASTVEQSYASGDVTKTSGLYVGGLVGALEAGSALVDAYAWGDVTGSGQDSGALIGYAVAGNTLTRVYATGAAERGGLVAVDDGNTSYDSCYWHSDKHARAVGSLADDPAGTFGRSEAELLLEAGYGGYDFVDVWVIEEGVGYAGLRGGGSAEGSVGEDYDHETLHQPFTTTRTAALGLVP